MMPKLGSPKSRTSDLKKVFVEPGASPSVAAVLEVSGKSHIAASWHGECQIASDIRCPSPYPSKL
jgi:hypothetical protein